eukprot:NODE_630_length_5208_cov_0.377178.p3 type:complete len:380 gc:universal NODE_630_length_5208_cov_0.377178:1364-225(-)
MTILFPEDLSLNVLNYIPLHDQVRMIGFSKSMTKKTLRMQWKCINLEELEDPRIHLLDCGFYPYNEFIHHIGFPYHPEMDYRSIQFLSKLQNLQHVAIHLKSKLNESEFKSLCHLCPNITSISILNHPVDFSGFQFNHLNRLTVDHLPLNFHLMRHFKTIKTLYIRRVTDDIFTNHQYPSITFLSLKNVKSRQNAYYQQLSNLFPNLTHFECSENVGNIENTIPSESTLNLTCFQNLIYFKGMGPFIANPILKSSIILSFSYEYPNHPLKKIKLCWIPILHHIFASQLQSAISHFKTHSTALEITLLNGIEITSPQGQSELKLKDNLLILTVEHEFTLRIFKHSLGLEPVIVDGLMEFLCGVDEYVAVDTMQHLRHFIQ